MAKILFVQREGRELNGVMAIASYISKTHESEVIVYEDGDSLEKKIKEFNPQVVGVPLMTKDHFWGVKTFDKIKSIDSNLLTLTGGPHPTFYTKIIEEASLDALCRGEGEKSVQTLLNRLENKEGIYDIPSLWVKEGDKIHKNHLAQPLSKEEIPLPKRDIYRGVEGVMESSDLLVMCSRGCPFDCHFCFNYGLKELYKEEEMPGPKVRVRDPEEVIREIKEAQKFKDFKSISFEDDIFGLNMKWLKSFKELYMKEVNLPFYALLRLDYISKNPSMVSELKEMGCLGVAVGIESGDEALRNRVLGKKLSDEQIFKGVEVLKKENMPFNTYIMFGLPGETLEDSWKSLDINLKIKANVAFTQIFHPYPGTKFFQEGGDEVEKAIISEDFSRFRVNYPYDKDWKKMQRMQKLAMATISYPIIRPLVPFLINLPLDNTYDKFSQRCWRDIYDKQKREGFKTK